MADPLTAYPQLTPSVTMPAPATPVDPGAAILAQAQQQYPFIKQYNPMVIINPKSGDDLAETWRMHDEGAKDAPRPAGIPMDRIGVEVYNPQKFGAQDLAAEFLHVDPRANQARAMLMQSLSPEQVQRLQREAEDYAVTMKEIQPDMKPEQVEQIKHRAMENAVDSALRGYVMGQWPAEANASMGYTPEQLQALNALKQYVTTGAQ